MFGGVGLGAAIAAMEGSVARKVVWATAQYLSFARPPDIVDFDVWTPALGRQTSQARVVAHVGDREILTVNAALGSRPIDISAQWARLPAVPPPEECPPSERWQTDYEDLHAHVEVRIARGRHERRSFAEGASSDGRVVLWARPKADHAIDAAMLAIIADHVPSGIGHALGRNAGGTSLDNTIRYHQIVETDWVACDIRIIGAHGGFVHGTMNLFSRDGRLMAGASQSMVLRVRDG